jgi:hypothetical protein
MTKAAELAKMGEVLTNSQIGGRRNIIINGAMQVAQRGTSSTGLGSGTTGYVALDRFRLEKADSPTARYTMTQDSNAPTGFANSMKVAVTTADTSVGADVHQYIDQFIEAQNLQQLAYGTSSAERITLSFYVKCSTAQTFALDLVNEDNSRYFNTTYTVSSADTWERKIITFPADTASGFNNDNGRGLRVRWTLVAGSNLTDGSVSTAWSGTQHIATNHANTWVGATSRAWQLTGVQLEVGSQATPFEHRSFGEELNLCRRYFFKTFPQGTAPALHQTDALYHSLEDYSGGYAVFCLPYPVEMRAFPTGVFYPTGPASGGSTGQVTYYDGSWKNGNASFISSTGSSTSASSEVTGTTSMTLVQYNLTADAEL